MTSAPLRWTLPATRPSSREQLRAVLPRGLWRQVAPPATGVEPAGPLLLSFHGTGFMDACFAWLAGSADLPPQRAWRDWREPPGLMLNPIGAPAYPASIRRGRPWGLQAEADGSELDGDGVPRGSPAWLRKLYLPQHDRFTVVVLELICRAPGWPPLDRQRVKEAALVVRRLRPSPPGQAERWDDWILSDPSANPRQGRWQPGPDDSPSAADRWRLASQPLSLAPATLEGMDVRCVLHGYLSLTGAEREEPSGAAAPSSRAQAAGALRARAETRLAELVGGGAGTLLPRLTLLLGSAMEPGLLEDTLLPAAPTALQLAAASAGPPLSESQLDEVLEQAVLALCERAMDPDRFRLDVAGSVISAAGLWSEVGADGNLIETTRARLRFLAAGGALPLPISGASATNLEVLVRHRLDQLLRRWITGQPLPVAEPTRRDRLATRLLPALLAAALVRARGCRLALANAMAVAQGLPAEPLRAVDSATTPPPGASARALHGLADLGEGLDSFLAGERDRASGDALAPWGTYTPPSDAVRLERVDRRLRALADHYAAFEAALAAAGAEVGLELARRAGDLEAAIAINPLRALLGLPALPSAPPRLLALGLDGLEPPAAGLLLLPGLGDGVAARLAALQAAVLSRYDDPANRQLETEALLEGQLRRPRFDAHHIYAVQVWVRVAGREPGEAERLIWSPRSEPFVIAEPSDLLGCQPQAVALPDVGLLLRDLGRVRRAGANPFLTLVPPPRSGGESNGGLNDLRRDWSQGTPVALVAPALAVVGLGMLSGAMRTVSRLPGFAWLRQVVVRRPAPERRP